MGAGRACIKNHVVSVLFARRYTGRGLVSIPVIDVIRYVLCVLLIYSKGMKNRLSELQQSQDAGSRNLYFTF